jgi:hypothetical protein
MVSGQQDQIRLLPVLNAQTPTVWEQKIVHYNLWRWRPLKRPP